MTGLIIIVVSSVLGGHSPDDSPPSTRSEEAAQSILAKLENCFMSIENIYAEYEVWAINKAHKTTERKLCVWEGMDRKRRWKRTLHFYKELYDNTEHPNYDPSLNWIVWSPDSEIHFIECSRYAFIKPKRNVVDRTPFIDGYFGYLGLASRDRKIDEAATDESNANRWRPSDYILPEAVRQEGWRVGPAGDDRESKGLTVLTREKGFGIDRLWLDPRINHALVKREIRHADGRLNLRLVYGQMTEVSPRRWLPREVFVESSEPIAIRCLASRLEVNTSPFAYTAPPYPPGTVVIDESNGVNKTIPGGEDLLEFTVDRARFFMQENPVRGFIPGYQIQIAVLGGALTLGLISYVALRLVRLRGRARSLCPRP